MKNREKQIKRLDGTVSFEKRRHPRFTVDLPIEYRRRDLVDKYVRVINASESGLSIYLSEQMEVGQYLRTKLFFPFGSGLKIIELVTQVVWMDVHLGKDRGDYRAGVRFIDISPADLINLKNYLGGLSG
ncbi:MAG TPA: PilZ domain-containing protein [Thermodesulfobacteriota bacterium]|nr:PilZ domain-containing protein [Thermodesulfobacteriota bacterium]